MATGSGHGPRGNRGDRRAAHRDRPGPGGRAGHHHLRHFRWVTHDVWIVYLGGTYGSATIHGQITGAAAGQVAAQYAQQFPYKKPAARLASVTLKAATSAYSLKVAPDLATRYEVKLFASSTARTAMAASPVQNVYVIPNGNITGGKVCKTGPVCDETYHIYTIVPPSALSTEIGKHIYPYVGVNLSPTSEPPPPKWLYLNAYHSVIGPAKKIDTGEYVNVLTFRFTIGNDGYYYNWTGCIRDTWTGCIRDTVSKDGLGLPGPHGCGTLKKVPGTSFLYLG
jgi:hypothetical protein